MKNTDWLGNLVSIVLFAVLAASAWGLSEFLQRSYTTDQGMAISGPNAIVENARIVRSGPQGQPRFRLDAVLIEHSEKDDLSFFKEPRAFSLEPNKPPTQTQAVRAIVTENQNRVDLKGNVVITRPAFDNQPPLRITTDRATLYVEEERAITDAPVLVYRGPSTLQGIGMKLDQKTQKLEILSESRLVANKETKK